MELFVENAHLLALFAQEENVENVLMEWSSTNKLENVFHLTLALMDSGEILKLDSVNTVKDLALLVLTVIHVQHVMRTYSYTKESVFQLAQII